MTPKADPLIIRSLQRVCTLKFCLKVASRERCIRRKNHLLLPVYLVQWIVPSKRDTIHPALAPEALSPALQANSMIAATKHRIFEMMFSASGSGCEGKAKPNAAQIANTANIPATA